MFFARIVFLINGNYDYNNLSNESIELFRKGDAVCLARYEVFDSQKRVIIEYGGFNNYELAYNEGSKLLRRIRYQMVSEDKPISLPKDHRSSSYSSGGLTNNGIVLIQAGLFPEFSHVKDKRIENDYVGIRVFEVEKNLDEVYFVKSLVNITVNGNFSIKAPELNKWNEKQDISLALLNASVGIGDSRLTFVLRVMSIEVLIDEAYKDDSYVEIIDNLVEQLSAKDYDYKNRESIKSQLLNLKKQSISQRMRQIVISNLPDKVYFGMSPDKFIAECYGLRSAFIHDGTIDEQKNKIGDRNIELRKMCLDLLLALSTE